MRLHRTDDVLQIYSQVWGELNAGARLTFQLSEEIKQLAAKEGNLENFLWQINALVYIITVFIMIP